MMKYLSQINGFWNWRLTNKLTSKQADLYLAIMHFANASGWKSNLSIPNSTLQSICDMSKSDLHRCRDALTQNSLISYQPGHKGVAGIYIIVPLYGTNSATNPGTNSATNPGTNSATNPAKNEKNADIGSRISPTGGNIYRKDIKDINNTPPNPPAKKTTRKPKDKPFSPPTIEEVRQYCQERGNTVDAQRFYDYYQAAEWADKSGEPVRNWKQKMIAVWEKNQGKQAVITDVSGYQLPPGHTNDGLNPGYSKDAEGNLYRLGERVLGL